MKSTKSKIVGALMAPALIGLAVWVGAQPSQAQQPTGDGVISGTVRSVDGPEAGVWVVAETDDLQTNFIKIVVTDDQGRFLLPDLPNAEYEVFVRGYGLIDSPRIKRTPGTENLALTAVIAPSVQEAAQYFPGNYWWSLLDVPSPDMFPGTGPTGNGISPRMTSQKEWFNTLKSNCNFCHQVGNELTRDLEHVYAAHPEFTTDEEAWEWRLGTGVRGGSMYGVLGNLGPEDYLKRLADWTRKIKAGAVPPTPPRPEGVERNVVITLWDIGDDHSFMHDMISTDKNNPTVNGGGRIYAVNAGHGTLEVVDPKENNAFTLTIPTRMARENIGSRFPAPTRPSLWWGDEHLWDDSYNPADPHNPMIDSKGRVWMTTKIRDGADPAYCNDAAMNKYADYFPLTRSGRQAGFYDPATQDFTLIDTCFATHHLQIDSDANETVYFNELTGPIVGWIDSKIYDETRDEVAAMGWCGQTVDTNGDGMITRPWNRVRAGLSTEELLYQGDTATGAGPAPGGRGGRGGAAAPNANFVNGAYDPAYDSLAAYSLYSVIPSPADDSVWGVSENSPGMLVRVMIGDNPPATCKTQLFQVPDPGFDPRGVDVGTDGVVWTALAGSSHLASFDVRKCQDQLLNAIDGVQCEEGWTLHRTDGPTFAGTDVPADFHYYGWVDQHDVMGFGPNTPMANGSNSDSIKILSDAATEEWTTLRVPYPMGYYARGMDARIDDPNAGWKGRALYSNYGTHFVWHIEGGKGTKGKILRFQIRPDPLAR